MRNVLIGTNLDASPVDADFTNDSNDSQIDRTIFDVCRQGDMETLQYLVRSGTSINSIDYSGRKSTPLHFAAGYGRRDIVEYLVNKGADIDAKDDGGLIPLHNACSFGHFSVVQSLIAAGSNPNAPDSWNFTPLHEAVLKDEPSVCLLLLQAKANPSFLNGDKKSPLDLAQGACRDVILGEFKKDELLDACRTGDKEVVLSLMTPQNVNCHASDGRKSTPLHLAAGYNRIKIVKMLINSGADVLAKDKGGLIPLHNACSYGHMEVCELLINAGNGDKQVNASDMWAFTPLHEAASKSRAEVCSLLLAHHADPFKKNCSLKTSVDMAPSKELKQKILTAFLGHSLMGSCVHEDLLRVAVDLLEMHEPELFGTQSRLLKQKVLEELNGCGDGNSMTVAICSRVEELLQFVHPFTMDTNLHTVVRDGASCSPQLLEHLVTVTGLPVNNKNLDGCTPLHAVASSACRGSGRIAAELIRLGADPVSTDRQGNTPLHVAAINSSLEVIDLLLRQPDVDPTLENLAGSTPLQLTKSPQARERISQFLSTDSVRSTVIENLKRVDLNEPDTRKGTVKGSENGDYLLTEALFKLLEASKAGDVEMVRQLVREHEDHLASTGSRDATSVADFINMRDIDGRHSSPLHFAAGYNRLAVVELLLQLGADVHAKDKGGLVPLHNASSYGHTKVAELLLLSGANVNETDLWRYTPLHEAAIKGKFEICRLLLKFGADRTKKNRDGLMPINLIKEVDQDLKDLFRGDEALLEAAKKGNLNKVRRLLTPDNINCRDVFGRNSTPLHLASGYNNLEIVEFLLQNGADANAQDKGGLIPLHNASSYGHVDVAAMLIHHGTSVNAVDKWGYTPLHEAAQKGRTQLCALLLAHGADPSAKNQDEETPYDLATASDVKSLLMDALPHMQSLGRVTTYSKSTYNILRNAPSTSTTSDECRVQGQGSETGNGADQSASQSMRDFLSSLGLAHLIELFEREQVTLEIVCEMGHEELKELGVTAYGLRHKIVKGVHKWKGRQGSIVPVGADAADAERQGVGHASGVGVCEPVPSGPSYFPASASTSTVLIELEPTDTEFRAVEEQMQSTIRDHKDNCGGLFNRYSLISVARVRNRRLWDRYVHRCHEIADDNNGHCNERFLFHGSPFIQAIVMKGFDERHAYIGGMFGAGIYFAENSSKSNQYVYGIGGGSGCHAHKNRSCYTCPRTMLLCRVALGHSFIQFNSMKLAHAPPGHHSIVGRPSAGGLSYAEYVIYRGEQAYPEYVINYLIEDPSRSIPMPLSPSNNSQNDDKSTSLASATEDTEGPSRPAPGGPPDDASYPHPNEL
ncbi:hypothetical protein Ciccas_002011 [Cichlidogyrus casuarinus]|uniref:Poly [ADP-ribose] polymerase n=1 Tax=Cichlidogyrus casuarinus TaxID=1844966 RepID=A0ABD2QIJ0_9PLAT